MWIRGLAAVVAGLLVAIAGLVGVEGMSSVLHPFPPGFDASSYEACREHVARYPTGVLMLCALGWAVSVFLGSWLATRLGASRHPGHGIIVGGILLGLAIVNMAMLPYPAWFWLNLVSFPLCFISGSLLGRAKWGAPIRQDI